MSWIDVHTHINMLEASPHEVIQTALNSGVNKMITIGTGKDDHDKVMRMVDELAPTVYGTLGFHPHDAKDYTAEWGQQMRRNLLHPRIVGVGEIGLDYYYSHSDHEIQRSAFREQMQIASDVNLPVEIHTRDAEDDTFTILSEFKSRVFGLLHCFTGTKELALKALDLGYNISISGVVTFKKAEALQEVVKLIPLDRLHLETDAPFLTPVPFRGKKNEPAFMVHTAKVVAELKGVSLDELAEATTNNALKLFKKLNGKL